MEVFNVMRVAAFAIFLLDLIAGSAFKLNYNCKLIWWLDFVSAISMVPLENFSAGADGNYLYALKAFKVARATRLLKMVIPSLSPLLYMSPPLIRALPQLHLMFQPQLVMQLRVVRLAKVVRLLRLINLSKKKVNAEESIFRIGDEMEHNKGDQVNADHLTEQLTTVITVKVRRTSTYNHRSTCSANAQTSRITCLKIKNMHIHDTFSQVLLVILMLMFGLPSIGLFLGNSCYNLEKTNQVVIDGMEQLNIMFSNTRFYDNSTHCDKDSLCRSGVEKFHQVLTPYLELYVSNITIAGA